MDARITFREGVFFEMSEAEYHATPALSASGVKLMRASPMDYWVRSPMNPQQAEVMANEESDAKDIGSAYDCRITCGKEAFAARYAPMLTLKDCPAGTLDTAVQIQARLRILGEKVGGNKPELIERLLTADPTAKIYEVLLQDYGARNSGRTFLDRDLINKIELAAAMIEKHPHLGKAFTGGAPQVSVFWRDPETNVPCKARYDYLKPRAIVDLKTFSNAFKRPVSRAIDQAFANYRYFIQATHYMMGAEHVTRFIREGLSDGRAPQFDPLTAALARGEDKQFLFVFQDTGPSRAAYGRLFPKTSSFYSIARDELNFHMRRYAECLEKFGTDPWVSVEEIEAFDDANLPAWAAE